MRIGRGASFVALVCFVLAGPHRTQADPAPAVFVSGGIQTGNTTQPLVFTWNSAIPVEGTGWNPAQSVSISLQGPLNSPGVSATLIALGSVTANDQGSFSTSVTVPYDRGITGSQANIPRPGFYAVRASGRSGTVTAAYRVNLCPATYLGAGSGIDWSHERGTRTGVLPGLLTEFSPERADPNWISVWDNRPIEIYGAVAGIGSGGAHQPARVSYQDNPITHYAHDTNFYLLPDPQYRWTAGAANYYSGGEDEAGVALGRIEVEWEALNNGSPQTYGKGQIGLPDWAIATNGDRMYVVGRWVLDAGHPEVGARSELHPPRLMAVMRQRPAVAAAQVDVYVSGHGGAANRYPAGMDALLNQGGRGGGRLRDVLGASDQDLYYRAGPVPLLELPLVNLLVEQLSGQSLSVPIYSRAGPGAFPWGNPTPENQPVNDMDYDFDVPLPPSPGAGASIDFEVVTHPQHTTAVTEAVTYAGNIVHIHLPYRGADNGIYARTLRFSWSAAAPAKRFRVTVDRLTVNSTPGEWHVWSDVGGQWTYLPNLAPALLQSTPGQTIAIAGSPFDVYLRDGDTLRVLVQGYRANCVDHLFGTLFGIDVYSAGLQLLRKCGPVNNDNLGGALLELPALPSSQGSYVAKAEAFQAGVTVQYLSPPQVSSECQGRGSLAPAINAGGIVGAGLSQPFVTRISPGGLISIFGQNFAPSGTARAVTSGDLRSGRLPANLACTCVAVDHRLAPLLYVSPALINVQVPESSLAGNLAVQVIANCGSAAESQSAASAAMAQPVAPEFFSFKQNANGVNPIAATDAITGALIGPTFSAARPGDYVALYMTGLGLTDPPFAVSPVSVTLNGVLLAASDILYAGAAPGYAGLYQVNIHIPTGTPNGNLPVSLSIGGVSTPTGAYLTVQR